MSLIKSIMHQLGLSGDPAKNFTLSVPAAPDGTMKLARGNAGATTQDIMTVDAAGKVAFPVGIDYPEAQVFNIACTPESGTYGAGALGYCVELVVGNLVTLTLAWDIPDLGSGTGAVILGYNAAARGLTPKDGRYWARGAGRLQNGTMAQTMLVDGYIAVFTYSNAGASQAGYTASGSLQFITAGK
jgi:hypothetical protein